MKESKQYPNKPKVGIVITVGVSLDALYPDFYPLAQCAGFEVVGICAADRFVANVRRQGVRVIEVPMTRAFTPFQDMVCLWKLWRIFRAERFDLIHYSTPKASVLAAMAGRLAGRSRLLYTNRGLAYTGVTGVKRAIAKGCEKLAARLADRVIAISPSLKELMVQEGLLAADKIEVFGAGSSKGVNLQTFRCDAAVLARARAIRQTLGLGESDVVFGYAGRFTVEKGIVELLEAFETLAAEADNVHLVMIGEQDQRVPLPGDVQRVIDENPRVHRLPYTDDMPGHLAAMDVFVLASYREGFGNVLIEASAMERAVIGSAIPGCRDAVKPGVTGLLVEPRSSASLLSAMRTLAGDAMLRGEMGKNGRAWVEAEFDRAKIWQRLLDVYQSLVDGTCHE
jgi:glycosyltransferase involved in cell wall biosynthesis